MPDPPLTFGTIPCCDCPCECTFTIHPTSESPTIVLSYLTDGTLNAGKTATTSADGAMEWIHPWCLEGYARSMETRVNGLNVSGQANGALVRLVHCGANGTDNLIFQFTKASTGSSRLQVFLGSTELWIANGILVPVQTEASVNYLTTCVSAVSGGVVYAWFLEGNLSAAVGARVDDVAFEPGNRIRLEWANLSTALSLPGTGNLYVDNADACDSQCPDDLANNFPYYLTIEFEGFQNDGCSDYDLLNETVSVRYQNVTSSPPGGNGSRHYAIYSDDCGGSFNVHLSVYYELDAGIYRIRVEWARNWNGSTSEDSLTAIYEFGATEPTMDDWVSGPFDATLTASSFTSGDGDFNTGSYLVRIMHQ